MHSRDKKKYKIGWKFSQKGNLWRILFAGNDVICGETRDTASKETYFFTVDIKTGKYLLKNYVPEKDNYWITLEEASSKYLFLGRFEQPGMPNHKGIMAIDISTGNKIWENTDLEFFYNTEDTVIAFKQNFESIDMYELNADTGDVIKVYPQNMYEHFYGLREKIISEKYDEINDYPVPFGNDASGPVKDILNIEIKEKISECNAELIERDKIVIFNYYRYKDSDLKDIRKKNYSNIICIYDKADRRLLHRDILNENSSYCVPDNFFTKNGYLYYIKEKNVLINIKL